MAFHGEVIGVVVEHQHVVGVVAQGAFVGIKGFFFVALFVVDVAQESVEVGHLHLVGGVSPPLLQIGDGVVVHLEHGTGRLHTNRTPVAWDSISRRRLRVRARPRSR